MTLDVPTLMRKGIALTDPIEREYYVYDGDPIPKNISKACALGTIKVVTDEARYTYVMTTLADTQVAKAKIPHLPDPDGSNPARVLNERLDRHGQANLQLIIASLNDYTDMSREAIAEWLDTLPDHKTQVEFEVGPEPDEEGVEDGAVAA